MAFTTPLQPVLPGYGLARARRVVEHPRPGFMRTALIVGPGRLRFEERLPPEPGPGQVGVRIEGCGLAASDLAAWEGRSGLAYPLAAGAPGHEAWGRVDSLGPGVTNLAVGDRVAVLSDHGYAEFDAVPAEAVVRLPALLDDEPFPGETLAGAFNVFRRSAIRPGDTVAVVGVGFLGALIIRIAARAQARVIGISRRPFAREVARRCGAWATLPFGDARAVADELQSLTGSRGCDRVIEVVGRQDALDLATELTRPRGRLVVAGHHDHSRCVNMRLWNERGLDVVNAHEGDLGVRASALRSAIDAELSGMLDCRSLYTHAFLLSELAQAFDTARLRPEGFLKAVVLV